MSENAIRSLQEENKQSFITHSRTKTTKIYIKKKTKQKSVYDSVSVKAGIVPSKQWAFQETLIFTEHTGGHFW